MLGRPLVTVITVVLNGKDQLKRTADSVLKQSYDNIEYIVVDGGSVDGSIDVVRGLGDSIDHWVSEPDSGIAAAFNKGIALARGEIVGLLNAGDLYERTAVAAIVDAYLRSPGNDVFCGSIRMTKSGSPPLECLSFPSRLQKETSVYHPTVFVRKSSYGEFGMYDDTYRFAMDYELLLRFKQRGAKFYVLDSVLSNMPLDGVSYRHWYEGLKEVRKARSKYFSFYDVLFHHVRAVAMNLAAHALKRVGLRKIYYSYWRLRNLQGLSGRRGEN